MHRLKRRRSLHALNDDELRRIAAAELVSRRIVLGLTPQHVLDRMGRRYEAQPKAVRRRFLQDEWCVYELARIEHALAADGYLSTFQRYARVVGTCAKFDLVHARQHRQHILRMRMRKLHAARRKRRAAARR